MNKQRRIISIIILVILSIGALFLIFYGNEKGNIDDVERIITNENGHKREDVEETFDMIEKEFNTKDYKGCKLRKIIYPSEKREIGKDIEKSYREEYNAEEVIYLTFEFITNRRPATGLVANEDYEYNAVFAKIDGKWILKKYGQG